MSKKLILGLYILGFAVILGFTLDAYSSPDGVSGESQSGCDCHEDFPSAGTSVVINGLPAAYDPGKNYSLTVVVSSDTVPGNYGGFDLAVSAGTLVVTDSVNTKIKSGDLTHTEAGHGQRSWSFNWTAPQEGSVQFNVAGLAANGFGSDGDAWNLYSTDITVIPEFPLWLLLGGFAAAAIVLFAVKQTHALRRQ